SAPEASRKLHKTSQPQSGTRSLTNHLFLLPGDSVSRMQVNVREGFARLPLACAGCQKSNDFKSSYVLWRVVHRFFHKRRGKCFKQVAGPGFKFQVSSAKLV